MRIGGLRKTLEEVVDDRLECRQIIAACLEPERTGEPLRSRNGETCRADEGKELGNIEMAPPARRLDERSRRIAGKSEPIGGEGGVAEEMRWPLSNHLGEPRSNSVC